MRLRPLALLVPAALALLGSTARAEDTHALIAAAAQAAEAQVVAWRRDIHEHPELGNREKRTSALVARELKKLGFDEVQTGIAHTGVVGILKGGKPGGVVALRADMDALPVEEKSGLPFASKVRMEYNGTEVPVMHACGHDAHTAILMGVATVLAGMRDQIPGTVSFVFQPAEEGAPEGEEGGARLMIKEGLWEKTKHPTAIFGLHTWPGPAGSILYRSGPTMAASDTIKIVVKGKQTHGSQPWGGIDPIVVAAQIVQALQVIPSRQLDITKAPSVVTIGSIHGGTKSNIISDEVRLQLTLRSYQTDTRKKLIESIKRIVKAQAESANMPADKMPEVIVSDDQAPALYNQPALCAEVRGLVGSSIGPDNVLTREPVMGAEDFAEYGLTKEKVPLCMFWLGTQPPEVVAEAKAKGTTLPSLHSPFFKPVPEPSIETGVKALTSAVIGMMK